MTGFARARRRPELSRVPAGYIAEATGERTVDAVPVQDSIHTSTEVGEWLAGLDGKETELHFLPAYSPELNPAELVWSLAKGIVRKEFAEMQSGLKARPLATFKAVSEPPKKVQRFSLEPDRLYAVS